MRKRGKKFEMRENEIDKIIVLMDSMNGIELDILYAFTRRAATAGTEQISKPPVIVPDQPF